MRAYHIVSACATIAALILCVSGVCDENARALYEPTKTRVVILSVVNKADEFSKSFKDRIKDQAQKALVERFTIRGFDVVDQSATDRAVADLKLDLNDRENWHPANLLPVAKKLDGRLVLLCVITDAHNQTNDTIFAPGGSREGIATVRAYLVDTQTGEALLKGIPTEGKSSGGAFGNFDKGMNRQARAVVLGMDKSLQSFLAAYPAGKK